MIEGLKPYGEYRESGVAWLGKIPDHWKIHRLKYILSEKDSRSLDGKEQLLRVSQYTGVTQRLRKEGAEEQDTRAKSLIGYKQVQPAELVINIMLAWNGSMGISRFNGIASPAYGIYRFNSNSNPWYFHYLLRSPSCLTRIKVASTGIIESRLRLYSDDLFRIESPLPPPEEQAAIVRFLDHANLRIDRFIRTKKKVIALLNEQKQAIIHRAVTRGIDPDVKMKDSRIPWLGEIPEHWETILLGRCLRGIEQGWSPVAAEGEVAIDQWVVLTLASVKRGVYNPAAIKPVSKNADIPKGIVVKNGDFLLTRSNTRDRVGDVCVADNVRPKTIFSDLIYRLNIRNEMLVSKFLAYQLLSPLSRGQIERDARGSSGTMPKISHRHIRSWRIVLPPFEEQENINGAIKEQTSIIIETINRTETEIAIIREYRTRLIADVVTGKIDVREAARSLPATAEEIPLEPDSDDLDDEAELEPTEAAA